MIVEVVRAALVVCAALVLAGYIESRSRLRRTINKSPKHRKVWEDAVESEKFE